MASFMAVLGIAGGAYAQPGTTPAPSPTPTPAPAPAPAPTPQPETAPPGADPAGMPAEPAPPAPAPAPAPPPAEQPPAEVPAPGEYPRSLPLRPLALPSGKIELQARTELADSEFFMQDPIEGIAVVRAGLGIVELEGNASFHLRDADDTTDPNPWSSIGAAARYVIDPDFTIGIEGAMFQPTEDERGYDGHLMVGKKFRFNDAAAIEARGGGGYQRYGSGDAALDLSYLIAQGRLQVAPSEMFSLEFIANARALLAGDLATTFTTTDYGLRGLVAVTPQLDVFAGFQTSTFISFAGTGSIKLFSLGVQGRVP